MNLVVSKAAYGKMLAAAAVSDIEWSGYGPVICVNGYYALEDWYIGSVNDTAGATELEPVQIDAAWRRAMASGYDPFVDNNITLAWVHRHPHSTGPFWSGIDERAIEYLTKNNGGKPQISVLYYGHGLVTARMDNGSGTKSLDVQVSIPDDLEETIRLARLSAKVEKARPVRIEVDGMEIDLSAWHWAMAWNEAGKKKKKGKGKPQLDVKPLDELPVTRDLLTCAICGAVGYTPVDVYLCDACASEITKKDQDAAILIDDEGYRRTAPCDKCRKRTPVGWYSVIACDICVNTIPSGTECRA